MKFIDSLKTLWGKIKKPLLIIGGGIVTVIIFLLMIKKNGPVVPKKPVPDVKAEEKKIDSETDKTKDDIKKQAEQTQQDIQNKTPEQINKELSPDAQKKIEDIKEQTTSDIMEEIEKEKIK